MNKTGEDLTALFASLNASLGDRFVTSQAVRDAHGRGEGLHDIMAPDGVAFPRSTEEVAQIVRLCADHKVPIIAFGVGTSLEGQIQALHGGISLDMSQMTQILATSAADLDCRVEAGVTREQLNAHIQSDGLFFPLDPGANATLGGMAATRASGTNAVRYGTMREVTLGLTVVTPQGEVIRTGGRARKSSAGYDLTRLYVGSEGTLGVITELQLRLFGIPEVIAAAVCQFEDLAGAIEAVTVILQMGIDMARIELLDELQMQASIAYSKLDGLREAPTLFMEFHGSPAAVDEQIAQVGEIVGQLGGGALQQAKVQEERNRLWTARHNGYWAARGLRPGCEAFATDACVPISNLAACITETKAEAAASGLICPIVGHVGDGNFHVLILFDPSDPAERQRADALAESIALRALHHGGTITGEHGIGLHKLGLMEAEHGEALKVMRAVKQALDPDGIMNPGKTIPAA
ncbi:FAD-binding oxidoreductase [Sphingosinicella rhizophila]|uniref:D-lactate dehydrogenase (cytochrome) n=1 Tax=Sphingosinicella rhizophila TaxID=3050082 RepID=A0ABU3Q626_9SPHN|nr:FAD-linked oxidase C-terminal domain-containing protein [Sphingosinicella sp. GR2756]MDT9598866.1 FAD-linked oxidase C-terminal domain-containing protein [Sphingosinicella sp. GR2756]